MCRHGAPLSGYPSMSPRLCVSGFCTEVGVLAGLGVQASIEMWINVFCVNLAHIENSFFQSENKPSPRELPQCVTFARFLALSWSLHCVALWAESERGFILWRRKLFSLRGWDFWFFDSKPRGDPSACLNYNVQYVDNEDCSGLIFMWTAANLVGEKTRKNTGFFSCLQLGRYKGEEIPEADTPRQMETLALQRTYLCHHWAAQQIVMGQLPARTLTPFTAGA